MLGIYSATERQRHLETGSYEPIEETGSAAELIETAPSAGRVAGERSEPRITALSSTIRMESGTLAPVPLAGCWPGHIVQVDGRRRGRTPPPYSSNRACKYSEYCTLAYVVQPNGAHCNVLDCSFLRQLAPNAFIQQKTPQ